MKQQEVFNKIGGIIREINEQYEYLQTTGGVYNDLELELLVANAHFLSDHIEILKKLNAHSPKPVTEPVVEPAPKAEEQPVAPSPEPEKKEVLPVEPTPEPKEEEERPAGEPRYFEPVIGTAEEPEEEPEETPSIELEEPAETVPTVEFEIGSQNTTKADETQAEPAEEVKPEPETIRHELTLEDIGDVWDEDEEEEEEEPPVGELEPELPVIETDKPEPVEPEPVPVVEAKKEEAKPEPSTPPAAAAAHTQIMVPEDQVITLNQRMSAQMGSSRMSDQLNAQPIADLKSAITLNDKLLYVKDLFNGYSLAYSEAIDMLNRMKTFEEAEAFLKNSYANKNNWADKTATADKFYALLQRRYM